MSDYKREIKASVFDKAAEAAAKDTGGLKAQKGQYGKTYGVFLNGCLMLSSEAQADGSRKYYSHMETS
jgi:hypothetical protein